jgi:SNF2 family DNA or RNA helicase
MIEVIEDRALLVKTKLTDVIQKHAPKTQLIAPGEILVPWTLDMARLLASVGAPALSPIVRDYNYPARFKPMPHQIRMSNFMTSNRRLYMLAEMGTGKTAAAVWSADYLIKQGRVKNVLVVCPLSIMVDTWENHIYMVNPGATAAVLHGSAERRRRFVAAKAQWDIVNYDGVHIIEQELQAKQYDLVIADESTYFKTASTRRWKSLNKVIKQDALVWALTGAPTPQGPEDAYGQAKLVTPHTVPRTAGQWKDMVMRRVSQFAWEAREDATDKVNRALSPGMRVAKRDVLVDLPPLVKTYMHVPLTPAQEKYYKRIREDAWAETKSGHTITAINAGAKMTKLLQIASGAVYAEDGSALEFDTANRLAVVDELIEQSNSKTIVFAPYRHTAQMLHKHLAPKGFALITGDTVLSERTKIFGDLESGELQGIVAIPQTMSHGVTATAASTIIWFSAINSAETYLQACNRIDRPGQKHSMVIAHIYGSPVERQVYNALQDRETCQAELLKLYSQFIQGI